MPIDPTIALLLDALDEAYDRKSWHGTNLRGSLRGVDAEQALWRPAEGRHNIRELAVHSAYWKSVVRRAVSGDESPAFPEKGSNWFARSPATARGWKDDLALLADEHALLRSAVAGLDPARLNSIAKKTYSYAFLIRGATAHDLYHAGQIQLLKRLQKA